MKTNDHRTRVTKMLIRKAFTDLLRQKPVQSISVKELCDRAGINRGTFYTHYSDILDLYEKMKSDMLSDFKKSLDPLLDAEGEELTSLKVTKGVFQCLKENADICTVTLGPYGDREFASCLINLGRERCIETYSSFFSGATRKQIEFFYAFVSSGCIGLLQKWIADGMSSSVEEVAKIFDDIMMYGIGFLRK